MCIPRVVGQRPIPDVCRCADSGQTDPPPDDEPERLPAACKETDFRMRMSPPRGTHRVGEQ
jgi:hypothetical protein